LEKAVRTAVDTGKVELGTDRTRKLALTGRAKMVVVAGNCPQDAERDLRRYCDLSGIPVVSFRGTSIEVGMVCGKPFPVCAMGVVEEGSSDILKAAEGTGEGK